MTVAGLDRRKLVAARLAAAEAQPFLAAALYALSPVAAPGRGSFAVDERWRLLVDPAVLGEWEVAEVAGVLLHEVGHVVRDHAGRARSIPIPEALGGIWNLAADAEINQDLLRDGIVLPGQPVTPELLGLPPGKVAEFYYRALEVEPPELDDLPDCGAGCTGTASGDAQRGVPTPPELDTVPGLSDGEQELLRRRLALAILAHGRESGTEMGGWARWAEAHLDPAVDWRPLLRGAIRSAIGEIAGMVDYSYRRPSRRRVPGVVLPSMTEPVPTVAVVIDTSGSMSTAQLDAAWTEVQGAIRAVGIRRELVTVLMNDVAVEVVDTPGATRVELSGGGGTDLRNGIDHAMGLRPRPGIVVVLTDGFTPWPHTPPPCRLIVGLIHDGERANVPQARVPPWATSVTIDAAGVGEELQVRTRRPT